MTGGPYPGEPFVMRIGAVFRWPDRMLATGKIQQGEIRAGYEVELRRADGAYRAVVFSVQTFSRMLDVGRAGVDVGLSLGGPAEVARTYNLVVDGPATIINGSTATDMADFSYTCVKSAGGACGIVTASGTVEFTIELLP